MWKDISNNPSFLQKHPAVPVSSDGSDGTWYPLTEKYTVPIAQLTGCIAYVPSLLCPKIRTIRRTRVLHYSQGLQLCCSRLHNAWRCLCLFLAECHILPFHYCSISDAALSPYLFSFEMLSLITIQSSLRIHRLPLHLLHYYRILHV